MSQHPVILLEPFYKWLDWLIAEHGLYLYMVTVWLSPLLIAWILRGGFWRRPPKPPRPVGRALKKLPPVVPAPLPQADSPRDDDSQSFAA